MLISPAALPDACWTAARACEIESKVKVVSHGADVWPGNPLLIGINGIALSPDADTLYGR
ncbi:hypothetical protein ACTMU2_21060 [Cupriavidus basilensis]